jgi:D-alanyl-D-alanine carboxypeptidase/D-alanyl-D-alanine-endopeptidase (penicillin-binding protein 4)
MAACTGKGLITNLKPIMQIVRRIIPPRRLHCQFLFCLACISILFSSCSLEKRIAKSASVALTDSSLRNAHVGISIYEPATGKYWYNYNAEKYFIPASNTKIPTCYAAMKYFGDSLVAGRVDLYNEKTAILYPSADPTFLHPDFKQQTLFRELHKYNRIDIEFSGFDAHSLGSGWSWNDYNEDYMAERSAFPIYGNIVSFDFRNERPASVPPVEIVPNGPGNSRWVKDSVIKAYNEKRFRVQRELDANKFSIIPTNGSYVPEVIPFRADNDFVAAALGDTLKAGHDVFARFGNPLDYRYRGAVIHSQPTDSLLKIMMHRSDNFFAEQSLLMVSNERLGIMNDDKIIDTLLATDLKDLPQPPRWTDGSGLSRYNLFSPKDFVHILNKMKDEFGMDRLKVILPTGGRGTLSSYYLSNKDRIYAKTGTLSGVVALSGFFYTRSNKLLIFSVLVNNHHGSATAIRRTVEKFLQSVCN